MLALPFQQPNLSLIPSDRAPIVFSHLLRRRLIHRAALHRSRLRIFITIFLANSFFLFHFSFSLSSSFDSRIKHRGFPLSIYSRHDRRLNIPLPLLAPGFYLPSLHSYPLPTPPHRNISFVGKEVKYVRRGMISFSWREWYGIKE